MVCDCKLCKCSRGEVSKKDTVKLVKQDIKEYDEWLEKHKHIEGRGLYNDDCTEIQMVKWCYEVNKRDAECYISYLEDEIKKEE